MEKLIPTIEEIKKDYQEIIALMMELKTKEDIEKFEEEYKVTIEINCDRYNDGDTIEIIRCEHWKNLDYVYYYMDERIPRFDVWCELIFNQFMTDITIDKLYEKYINGIKWICEINNVNKEDIDFIKELINVIDEYNIEID